MSNQCIRWFFGALSLVSLLLSTPASAATLGLVADNSSKKVTVFDADTSAVLATVAIPTVGRVGDCAIKQDQTEGYVSDSAGAIWVLDLTKSPARLSAGTNPIWLPIHPQELAITNDQKYLLAAGSFRPEPIYVVEVSSRLIRSSYSTGGDCNGLDVAADGTVLAGSARSNLVKKLTLSSTGVLSATGLQRSAKEPINPYITRNGKYGIVVTFRSGTIASFSTATLATISSRTSFTNNGDGICAAITPNGDRCFVRTNRGVDAYLLNPSNGSLSANPLFHIRLTYPNSITFYGMDQLALAPDGSRLYVGGVGVLNVYDTASGALLNTITNPGAIVRPTGVCVRGNLAPVAALPAAFSVLPGSPVPVTASVFDADGDALHTTWSVDGGAPVQLDSVPANGPPTTGSLVYTQNYSIGTHTVQLTVFDDKGDPTTVSTTITVQQSITITGTVFADTNNNQRQDTGEPAQSNCRVYADLNNNAKWDATEPSALSNTNGTYALVVAVPGTYFIREVPQTGWKLTAPTSGNYKIVATAGLAPVCNFGNRPGN